MKTKNGNRKKNKIIFSESISTPRLPKVFSWKFSKSSIRNFPSFWEKKILKFIKKFDNIISFYLRFLLFIFIFFYASPLKTYSSILKFGGGLMKISKREIIFFCYSLVQYLLRKCQNGNKNNPVTMTTYGSQWWTQLLATNIFPNLPTHSWNYSKYTTDAEMLQQLCCNWRKLFVRDYYTQ